MCDLGLKTMAVISASHLFAESSRDDYRRVGPAPGLLTRQTQGMSTISGATATHNHVALRTRFESRE